MPLYRFIIHGRIAGESAPNGFYATRWCRASDQEAAAKKVFDIVRADLNKQSPNWSISDLEIEKGWRIRFWEIGRAPNRGFTFYSD
jgi:hypothetical protein